MKYVDYYVVSMWFALHWRRAQEAL